MLRFFGSLSQSPEKSWKRFKLATGLFVVAIVLIFAGAQSYVLLQIPGLVLLVIALFLAIWGYLGILSYRLSGFGNKWKPTSKDNKETH